MVKILKDIEEKIDISFINKDPLSDKINPIIFPSIDPLTDRFCAPIFSLESIKDAAYHVGGKCNGKRIFGLVYLIVNHINGKIKFGRTENFFKSRIDSYFRKSKKYREKPSSRKAKYPDSIYYDMNELYKKGEFLGFSGEKYLKENFEWIPWEIVWASGDINFDRAYIESLETWWQNKLGTRDSDIGYDLSPGSFGRHKSYKFKGIITPLELKSLLEQGNTATSTIKILKERHHDELKFTEFSHATLNALLLQFFPYIPHKGQSGPTWEECQFYFMKPLFEVYIKKGLNPLQISKLYINQGLGKLRILFMTKKIWEGCKTWSNIKRKVGIEFIDADKLINPYLTHLHNSFEDSNKAIIADYIIKGYWTYEICKMRDIPYSFEGISTIINNEWGSIHRARMLLVSPLFELLLKKNVPNEQIAEKVEFFKRNTIYAASKSWFGMSTRKARFLLVTGLLEYLPRSIKK